MHLKRGKKSIFSNAIKISSKYYNENLIKVEKEEENKAAKKRIRERGFDTFQIKHNTFSDLKI